MLASNLTDPCSVRSVKTMFRSFTKKHMCNPNAVAIKF